MNEILESSLNSLIGFTILAIYIVYLSITLIFISISFIQIYFSNAPRYIERDVKKDEINSKLYIPIYVIIGLVCLFCVLFLLGNNHYYNLFESFFLIID